MTQGDFAAEAYRACLYGQASAQQQQSAASQIILLHGLNGELLRALQACADLMSELPSLNGLEGLAIYENARAAIAKATGEQA